MPCKRLFRLDPLSHLEVPIQLHAFLFFKKKLVTCVGGIDTFWNCMLISKSANWPGQDLWKSNSPLLVIFLGERMGGFEVFLGPYFVIFQHHSTITSQKKAVVPWFLCFLLAVMMSQRLLVLPHSLLVKMRLTDMLCCLKRWSHFSCLLIMLPLLWVSYKPEVCASKTATILFWLRIWEKHSVSPWDLKPMLYHKNTLHEVYHCLTFLIVQSHASV